MCPSAVEAAMKFYNLSKQQAQSKIRKLSMNPAFVETYNKSLESWSNLLTIDQRATRKGQIEMLLERLDQIRTIMQERADRANRVLNEDMKRIVRRIAKEDGGTTIDENDNVETELEAQVEGEYEKLVGDSLGYHAGESTGLIAVEIGRHGHKERFDASLVAEERAIMTRLLLLTGKEPNQRIEIGGVGGGAIKLTHKHAIQRAYGTDEEEEGSVDDTPTLGDNTVIEMVENEGGYEAEIEDE